MKWVPIILMLLISCTPITQEVSSKPAPKEVLPVEEPEQPPLESQIKAPPVTVPTPKPTPTEVSKSLTPLERCLQECEENCGASAQNACTQRSRPECKAGCGNIIDPSACTQACTYVPNQPSACKQFLSQFCSAQCERLCH